ncbi:hypothetical protein KIN20_031894 [Parelaphostrongylus tenuis]|uniref:Uncharacterized protein n=1 Tax=Parelaphostrongylus tenuis TaxID=148309 RepID=A0AAD5WI27_PARTN|nr:hypothetical protein KIN20_031894 [Parelaphostrongylus tenuis]
MGVAYSLALKSKQERISARLVIASSGPETSQTTSQSTVFTTSLPTNTSSPDCEDVSESAYVISLFA